MRIATVLMALVFLFGAAVQYNDPDPFRWLLVYLAAAALSLQAYRVALPWWLPAAVGGVVFIWAFGIALGLDPSVLRQMFAEFGMGSLEIEEAREVLGLVIIGTWMCVLARMGWKHGR